MEPDILANPGKPLMSSTRWPTRLEPSADMSSAVEAPPALPVARPHATPVPAPNGRAVANGLPALHGRATANGHLATPDGIAYPATRMTVVTPELVRGAVDVPREDFYMSYGKRVLDVVGSLAGLVLSAPLFLLLALLVKLESRGPVFYKSRRIGWRGRSFTFYKFRSMVDGAHHHREHLLHLNEADGPVFKLSRDPRVTRIGRWMRTTSLDEIPQFLNVLKGEMSLVGPRPPLPEEVAHYEPWQCGRLAVRPGITCLWQISGRSTIGFQEWMRLDLEYIRHQSFWLDLKILLRTIPAVLSREGAF